MFDRISATLSRRNLLIGLAASATAATAADAAAAPKENPELIAMADALPAVVAEYVAARDNVRAIVAEWSPQWPVPPESIYRFAEGCEWYRTIDGLAVELPSGNKGFMQLQQIGTPEHFTARAASHEADAARYAAANRPRKQKFETFWAERNRERIEPARAFWAEVDRIKEASGIEAAKDRRADALEALKGAVDRIMVADDWTITGAVIKAQALASWAEVDDFARALNNRGPAWADLLAASIVKHAA